MESSAFERGGRHAKGSAAIGWAVPTAILIAAGFALAPASGMTLRPAPAAAGAWLADHLLYAAWLKARSADQVLPVIGGALILVSEANLLIRLILQTMNVAPRRPPPAAAPESGSIPIVTGATADAPPLDRQEYNAGRFIGILERLLIYVPVLRGQCAAIGLILAAKSFARFKETDGRDFAEYVLIGTLLSVTCAAAVGELIRARIGLPWAP